MKKSYKLLSLFGVSAALAFGGISFINNQDNNISCQTVQAAATININFYSGYTKSNVLKANTGKLSKSDKAALVKGSMAV